MTSWYLHLIISHFPQGLRFSPKKSAHLLFPVFYFTTFYSSADPLLHYRPATNGQGRPHHCSLSPAVGGSMRSQTEAISNLPDSSPTYPVLPLPAYQHHCHELPVARILLELFLPYLPVPPIPSTTQATTRRPSLNSVPK